MNKVILFISARGKRIFRKVRARDGHLSFIPLKSTGLFYFLKFGFKPLIL
jgi:hypothetical protein